MASRWAKSPLPTNKSQISPRRRRHMKLLDGWKGDVRSEKMKDDRES